MRIKKSKTRTNELCVTHRGNEYVAPLSGSRFYYNQEVRVTDGEDFSYVVVTDSIIPEHWIFAS